MTDFKPEVPFDFDHTFPISVLLKPIIIIAFGSDNRRRMRTLVSDHSFTQHHSMSRITPRNNDCGGGGDVPDHFPLSTAKSSHASPTAAAAGATAAAATTYGSARARPLALMERAGDDDGEVRSRRPLVIDRAEEEGENDFSQDNPERCCRE